MKKQLSVALLILVGFISSSNIHAETYVSEIVLVHASVESLEKNCNKIVDLVEKVSGENYNAVLSFQEVNDTWAYIGKCSVFKE